VTAATLEKSSALSPQEHGRLVELETVVERGRDTFVAVGRALSEIRDGKLYRATHRSFKTYLRRAGAVGGGDSPARNDPVAGRAGGGGAPVARLRTVTACTSAPGGAPGWARQPVTRALAAGGLGPSRRGS
jgi:hypothetical protein